jgi:hypothetical protein
LESHFPVFRAESLGRRIWIDFLCTNKGAHAMNGNATEKEEKVEVMQVDGILPFFFICCL